MTNGASEGKRWETERMYGGQDVVLWAIMEGLNVIGSALKEADADLIVKLHNHPWVPDLLIDHDAPVCEICGEGMAAHAEESLLFQEYMTLHNAHEADQQTITELRKALEDIAGRLRGPAFTPGPFTDPLIYIASIAEKALAAIAATGEGKSS